MYHQQAGHMSRPPSPHRPRPTHVPLSLRTTITPTRNAPQQQPSPPNTSTPKPISDEKFPKALKLYTKYYMVKGLAQQAQAPHSAIETTNNNLNIPIPTRARSLTSRGSSRPYTPSVSTSAYDNVTDISSVLSFGEESHSSGTPNGNTELTNFNGEVVKQRIRRPLTPVSKAKAALIRHLESCRICRTRRVACDLEHHDIASLEDARKLRARTRQREHSAKQTRSTISNFSQNAPGSTAAVQNAAGGTIGQTNTDFLGIGQQEELLHIPSSDPAPVDAQSPGLPDPLSEMLSYPAVPASANFAMPFVNDSYSNYQNGDMIALGVLRGIFYICAHRDGLCQQACEDRETLEAHFETHFSYNRITPAHRFMCINCECMNNFLNGPCSNCGSEGTIEVRIYGTYIRIPTFQRYGPNGQDFLRTETAPYFPSMGFGLPDMNLDFGLDGGMGNGNGNGNYPNNQGNFFFQNDNTFEDAGSQGGDENGYTTPRSGGGYPFQGNWARNRAKESPFTARYWYAKALHTNRHHKVIALTLMLLVALILLFQVHEWLFAKARMLTALPLLSHPNLPVFGFVGILASSAICYTYWSVKNLGVQRFRRAQCRPRRCPLHDIPTLSFHYRQTAPNTFVRGGLFS